VPPAVLRHLNRTPPDWTRHRRSLIQSSTSHTTSRNSTGATGRTACRPLSVSAGGRATGTRRTARGAQQDLLADEESDDLRWLTGCRRREAVADTGYRGASGVTRDLFAHWRIPTAPLGASFSASSSGRDDHLPSRDAFPGRSGDGFKSFRVPPSDFDRLLRGEKPAFEEVVGEFYRV